MAWQLVYTSSPELLEAGRSGYGTVAKHEAIRATLQSELERISQFSREDGLNKNRTIFAHRILDLRGERYHVISRISDAGYDYTGRTNHIAHHIVLTADEAASARTASCSPADVILWASLRGFWRDSWEGPSRLFGTADAIPMDSATVSVSLQPNGAVTWRQVTRTSSNAAILAPGGVATDGCWLLYREDQSTHLLALIGESLCLHADPWAVSFSTDTQPTDRIEELRWRGVHVGSPLEQSARQSVRPVLDLASPSTLPPPVTSACELAETGQTASASQEEKITDRRSVDNRKSASTISAKDSTKGSGRTIGEPVTGKYETARVSLKDKMKGTGKPVKPKAIPLLAIIGLSTVLVAIIIVSIWHTCVLDAEGSEAKMLTTRANTIAHLLEVSPPTTQRIRDLVHIGWTSYMLIGPTKKEQIISAPKILDELIYKLIDFNKGLDDLCKKYNGLKKPDTEFNLENGLVSEFNSATKKRAQLLEDIKNGENAVVASIIRELDKGSDDKAIKTTKDLITQLRSEIQRKTQSPPTVQSEQTFTLKVNGNLVSNGTSISATNGQILHLEGSLTTGLPVSISKSTGLGNLSGNELTVLGEGAIDLKLSANANNQISTTETNLQIILKVAKPRITKIEFMNPTENAWDRFFGSGAGMGPLPGWSFYQTNGIASKIMDLISNPITFVSVDAFERNYPRSKKDLLNNNATNAGSCFLKKVDANQEITLTITVDTNSPVTNILGFQPIIIEKNCDKYICKPASNLSSTLNLLSGGYAIDYKVNNINAVNVDDISNKVNRIIQESEIKLQIVQQEYDNNQNVTQLSGTNSQRFSESKSPLEQNPALNNAGLILAKDIKLKNDLPKNLTCFSSQLKGAPISKSEFRRYLNEVLQKIISESKGKISYSFITEKFKLDKEFDNDYQFFINIRSAKLDPPKDDDNILLNNISIYFTQTNLNEFNKMLVPPKPTPTPRNYAIELSSAKKSLENIKRQFELNPTTSIQILDSGNKSLLIFTQ